MKRFLIEQEHEQLQRFTAPRIEWDQSGQTRTAEWWSANERPAPKKVVAVDDRLTADQAIKYASQGTAMLWLGDFQNAKQLLSAMGRRIPTGAPREKRATKMGGKGNTLHAAAPGTAEQFYRIRQARAQRSRLLSMLLVPLKYDTSAHEIMLPLPRAPRIWPTVEFAYGQASAWQNTTDTARTKQLHLHKTAVVSLQELVGAQGAHQWFVAGVTVPILEAKIYPHYGTFLPTRHEYVDLVARAPLGEVEVAFDIGTGTGVLAAVLASRGVPSVIGTDIHQSAVNCARDNFARLGIQAAASAQLTNMFAAGRADLIVCNPPWIPGSAASTLDAAIYDPGSKMLLQFLGRLPDHLTPDGEGWLVISDLAELLGLRSRQMLLDAIERSGLEVVDRLDTVPTHSRVQDASDVLHEARSREVTSLWRLRVARGVAQRPGRGSRA